MNQSMKSLLVMVLAACATLYLLCGSCGAAEMRVTLSNDAPSTGAAKTPASTGSAVAKGIEFFFKDARTNMGLKEITVSVSGPQVNKTALYKGASGWFPASFANGQYKAVASAAGYQTYSFAFDTTPLKQYSRIEVSLDPAPVADKGVLVVYVGDEATKKPLSGVTVGITGSSGARSGVTGGSQNTAVFQDLRSGTYNISASPSGYQEANSTANIESPKSAVVYLWVKPSGGYAVNVKVNNPDGKAISGASVIASGAFGTVTATTTGDGAAKLMVPAGKATIIVKATGYSDTQLPNIGVPFTNPPVLVVTLSPSLWLNVTVTDQKGGGIAGAQVAVRNMSPGGASPAPIATDGKGNVSLSVSAGSYSVIVSAKGYKDSSVGNVTPGRLINVVLSR
jgi:hypothetical protein